MLNFFLKSLVICCLLADVLLCHDDELDTRRIAFILYLVPPWKEEDGGALDLFDMDGRYSIIIKNT